MKIVYLFAIIFLVISNEAKSQILTHHDNNSSSNDLIIDTALINRVEKIRYEEKYLLSFLTSNGEYKFEVFDFKKYRYLNWGAKQFYLKVDSTSKIVDETKASDLLFEGIVVDSFINDGLMRKMLVFFLIEEDGSILKAGLIKSTFSPYLDGYVKKNISNFQKIIFTPATIKNKKVKSIICLRIDPYYKEISYRNDFFQNDYYYFE
jgi:hypothetical protein